MQKQNMSYKIAEYKISEDLQNLDLNLPENLSFFPENLKSTDKKENFIFTESMMELNKYFKARDIKVEIFGGDTELYRSRKNADIYLPAIFFSLSVISENPNLISVSLNVLSNYIYDVLKGSIGKKTAHVEFHIETKEKGSIKKIDYNGDVEGLKGLEKIIKAMK